MRRLVFKYGTRPIDMDSGGLLAQHQFPTVNSQVYQLDTIPVDYSEEHRTLKLTEAVDLIVWSGMAHQLISTHRISIK
jgi:hypothetical protein